MEGMTHLLLVALTTLACCCAAASAQTTRPAGVPLPPDGDAATKAVENSPRHGEWVDVPFEDGKTIKSWVAYPERADNAPVVIVIHEIFGMSDWVRGVADSLAAQGFVAVAPDLLSGMGPGGGGTDSFPEGEVRNAIRKVTPEMANARLDAVSKYAVALPSTTDAVGVVGFCWGGSGSFNYAAHAPADLKAAVVYYGTAPDDLSGVKVPVLGNYGGDDARVTSTVEPTKTAMERAGKTFDPHVYAGAGHGFLRQQSGRDGANEKAAKEAWSRTIAFFKEHLEAK